MDKSDSSVRGTSGCVGQKRQETCVSGLAIDVLTTTIFFALVAGLVESGYWLVKTDVLRQVTFMPPRVTWMAPVGYLVLFAIPGTILAPIAWRLAETEFLWDSARILALLAMLSCVFLLGSHLHFVAQLLLAAGLASMFTYFLRRCDATRLWIRVSTGAMLLTVFVLGLYEQSPPGAVVAMGKDYTERPNVLLIVMDTVRADKLGSYGARPSPTPNLDRLASKGVVFEQATSTAPWTLPSIASMSTGRLPRQLSADWFERLDGQFPTVAEYASRNGYITAGFVANTRYCGAEVGLARGFQHFEDYSTTLTDFVMCTAAGRRFAYSFLSCRLGCINIPGRKTGATINEAFLKWLGQQQNRPYFAFLNYLDAHDPYVAPSPFDRYRPTDYVQRTQLRFWWSMHKADVSTEIEQLTQNAYVDCIRYLDKQIGKLLQELERRGELQNTVIIVTSDHGEHLGDHGLYLHGNSLFQELVHVPLIVSWPRYAFRGVRVTTPVSLTQLPSTIANIITKRRGPFVGYTLRDSLEQLTDIHSPIISEIITPPDYPPCQGISPAFRGSMASIRLGRFKLIRNDTDEEQLYDLTNDPGEKRNLIAEEEHSYRHIVGELRAIDDRALLTRSNCVPRLSSVN